MQQSCAELASGRKKDCPRRGGARGAEMTGGGLFSSGSQCIYVNGVILRPFMEPTSPQLTRTVFSDAGGGSIEILATVAGEGSLSTDLIVVNLAGLHQAVRDKRPEIIVKAPAWWPTIILFLFALIVIIQLSIPNILAFKGFASGYNVELCPKIIFKGAELSNCVKLTKPKTD
jgi:hypothetical protein